MILEKINLKIEKLKTKIKLSFTNPILSDPDVLAYLGTLQREYVIIPIYKASKNFAFICTKFYISKILSKVGEYNNIQSNSTYSKAHFSKDDIITNNESYFQKFNLKLTAKDRSPPIMYWLSKLHKAPIGARFIIASKNYSTKPLSGVISKIFKILFKHVENLHNKTTFYSSYKKFWVAENYFPITEKLNIINTRKRTKRISIYGFSTLYTTIPHNLLSSFRNKTFCF